MSNVSTDAEVCEFDLAQEMAIYDALPAPVRAALADATVKFAATAFLQQVQSLPPHIRERLTPAGVVHSIRVSEAHEREAFAQTYRARYGRELPHVAAGARPLRSLPPPADHSTRRG